MGRIPKPCRHGTPFLTFCSRCELESIDKKDTEVERLRSRVAELESRIDAYLRSNQFTLEHRDDALRRAHAAETKLAELEETIAAQRERNKRAVELIRAAMPVRVDLKRCDDAAEDAVARVVKLEGELADYRDAAAAESSERRAAHRQVAELTSHRDAARRAAENYRDAFQDAGEAHRALADNRFPWEIEAAAFPQGEGGESEQG